MLSEIDYSYLAGLIDGEGSVSLTSKINRNPCLSMVSTTKELIDFVKNKFGGSICIHKKATLKHKESWIWRLSSNDTINILGKIIPYMKEPEKIRRGKLIISFYKENVAKNGWYTNDDLIKKEEFEKEFFKNSRSVKLKVKSIRSTINRRKVGREVMLPT